MGGDAKHPEVLNCFPSCCPGVLGVLVLLLFICSYFILFYFILFYFILFYFILFYFILFYFILFYFILFYFILFYFILFYFILFYFILFYFILFYFILFYFILFYFILFYFIFLSTYEKLQSVSAKCFSLRIFPWMAIDHTILFSFSFNFKSLVECYNDCLHFIIFFHFVTCKSSDPVKHS